jgi:hypothetical protein
MASRFAKVAAELRDETKATADEIRARGDVIDAMLHVRHHRLPQAPQPSDQPARLSSSELTHILNEHQKFVEEQQDRSFHQATEMAHAKDPKELLEIQNRYLKESLESMLRLSKIMGNPTSYTSNNAVSSSSDQTKDKHIDILGEA